MTYADLISSVITALTYGLEIGIVISNRFLELDENGFYFIENKTSEEERKTYIRPSYVINFLFKKIVDLGEISMPLIVYMVDYLDANNLKNIASYVEIVKLIGLIQKKPLSKSSDKAIDFDYGRLKALLSKCKRDEATGFRNEIISISDFSYEEVRNIVLINPILAGKLEKMYQLEKLLEKYCKMELAKYLIPSKKGYDYHSDQLGLLDSVNLSDYEVDWNIFYDIIDEHNYIEMQLSRNSLNYNLLNRETINRVIGLPNINEDKQLLLEPNE